MRIRPDNHRDTNKENTMPQFLRTIARKSNLKHDYTAFVVPDNAELALSFIKAAGVPLTAEGNLQINDGRSEGRPPRTSIEAGNVLIRRRTVEGDVTWRCYTAENFDKQWVFCE